MKLKIFIGFLVLIILIVSNFFYIIGIGRPYHYSTRNNEFKYTCVPTKGVYVEDMKNSFSEFKLSHPEYSDLILYRRFEIKVWEFWKWWIWIAGSELWWDYPYLKSESKKIKEKPS